MALEAVKVFQLERMEDLLAAREIALTAFQNKALPKLDEIPTDVLCTTAVTLAFTQLLVLMLVPPVRRGVFYLVDTVLGTLLALALVVALVALVLGLPFGAAYIGIKGSYFMGTSLIHTFPKLKALCNLVLGALGQPTVP